MPAPLKRARRESDAVTDTRSDGSFSTNSDPKKPNPDVDQGGRTRPRILAPGRQAKQTYASSSGSGGGSNTKLEDSLKYVARQTSAVLQKAWALEKQCDVVLRLKRHSSAQVSMQATTERQRLRLVVRIVTEEDVSKREMGPVQPLVPAPGGSDATSAAFTFSAPMPVQGTQAAASSEGQKVVVRRKFHQHIVISRELRDDEIQKTMVEDRDEDVPDGEISEDAFATSTLTDVTAIIKSLTVAYQAPNRPAPGQKLSMVWERPAESIRINVRDLAVHEHQSRSPTFISSAPASANAWVEIEVKLDTGGMNYFYASRALAEFMTGLTGAPDDDNTAAQAALTTRGAVLEFMWNYVLAHDLLDAYNPSLIVCDAPLQDLLDCQSLPLREIESTLFQVHLVPAPRPLSFKVPLRTSAQMSENAGSDPAAPQLRKVDVWHLSFDRLIPSPATRAVRSAIRRLDRLDDQRVFASLISEHRQQSSSKPQSQKAAATSPTRKNNSKSAPESHTKCNDSEDEGFDTTEPTTTPAVTTRYAEGCLRRYVGLHQLHNRMASKATSLNRCVRDLSFVRLLTAERQAKAEQPQKHAKRNFQLRGDSHTSTVNADLKSFQNLTATAKLLFTMKHDLGVLCDSTIPTLQDNTQFQQPWVQATLEESARNSKIREAKLQAEARRRAEQVAIARQQQAAALSQQQLYQLQQHQQLLARAQASMTQSRANGATSQGQSHGNNQQDDPFARVLGQ